MKSAATIQINSESISGMRLTAASRGTGSKQSGDKSFLPMIAFFIIQSIIQRSTPIFILGVDVCPGSNQAGSYIRFTAAMQGSFPFIIDGAGICTRSQQRLCYLKIIREEKRRIT